MVLLLRCLATIPGAQIPPRMRRIIGIVFCIGFVALGVTVGALGALVVELAERTDISLGAAGSSITGYGIGQLIAAFASGWFVDRSPGHPQLVVAFIAAAVGCGLLPSARNLGTLLFASSLFGVAMGIYDTAGNVMVLWLWGAHAPAYLQASHACFGIGAFASPFLIAATGAAVVQGATNASAIVETAHTDASAVPAWAAVLYANAACLIALATVTLALPSPRRTGEGPPAAAPKRGAPTGPKAAPGLAAIDAGVDAPPSLSFGAEVHRAPPQLLPPPHRRARLWHGCTVLSTAVYLGFYLGLEMGFGGFAHGYCTDHLGTSSDVATAVLSLFWGSYTLGRIASAPIALRVSPQRMLVTFHTGAFGATAALLARPDSVEVIWAVAAVYGLSISGMFAAAFSLCEVYVPVSGGAATVFIMGSSLGKMSLPVLVTLGYSLNYRAFAALLLAYTTATTLALAGIVLCGRRARVLREAERERRWCCSAGQWRA